MDPRSLIPVFQQSVSPVPEPRRQAEAFLKQASTQPGYALALLQLMSLPEADAQVKQSASVIFKNHLKYHWSPQADHDTGESAMEIPPHEKEQIRTLLVAMMLSAPARIRAQLSEALTIVSSHDFPNRWPTLLPELVSKLSAAVQSSDHTTMDGVLQTANSIFKRFRTAYIQDVAEELKHCQDVFAAPLLTVFRASVTSLEQASASGSGGAELQLQVARAACRIFYSLNVFGLSPLFETVLPEWMDLFHRCMTLELPVSTKEEDAESPLHALKAAVCANINLYMEKEEEDFEPYMQTFVQDVWSQLVKVSSSPGLDNLTMQAMRFLTTVAKSVNYKLFEGQDVLRQICESIVIPNMRVRESDEELFEMNWVEYVRADAEGSDAETRRRAASDLIKALTDRFPQQVTALCSTYVGSMLTEYGNNRVTKWKAKDCALYLVTALTVRGKTAATGATKTNELVNVADFYAQHVLPELQVGGASGSVDDAPMIRADALKFINMFRSQIPKESLTQSLPHMIALLRADSNVVHSYAASTLERILAMKDPNAPSNLRFTPAELLPLMQPLLEGLFHAVSLPDSEENEYLVKCLMRVISFLGASIAPVAPLCLQRLADMLLRVCQNPRAPTFNHYLFESVAALIRYCCSSNADMASTFEQMLFPACQVVLAQDVQEFAPYVFQVLALLLELRPSPVPGVYLTLFAPLLSPVLWERTGNIPALVRLFQAYFTRCANELVAANHLLPTLGVFQKLVSSKAHDHEGLALFESVLDHVPHAALDPHMTTVWTLLFSRLQNSRTPKYTRAFLAFFARFVLRRGGEGTLQSINKLQPGLFNMILNSIVVPNLGLVHGDDEVKVLTIALGIMVAEIPSLLEDGALWGRLVAGAVATASQSHPTADGGGEEDALEDSIGAGGYAASFARLANAQRPHVDHAPHVADAPVFLATKIAALSKVAPGRVGPLIASSLSAEQQQQLAGLLNKGGVSL